MKKFLLIFLIGQMFVCSFVYGQSFYDIYTLNTMGSDEMNSYYLEETTGANLSILYEELVNQGSSIEVIKEPVSMDGVQEYEVFDTEDVLVSHKIPISKEKRISYYILTKEEFVDSTGKFKTNLSDEQMKRISDELHLTIKPYLDEKISYLQVAKQNAVNIGILLCLSQFVLLVYTFSRIKINAVKKLNGFSSIRMIVDSFHEFIPMELLAIAITVIVHFLYCTVRGVLSFHYVCGLIATGLVVLAVTMILLLLTQMSIRWIDISSMMKNQVYSTLWNNLMNIVKVVFIFAIAVSVSLLGKELEGYTNTAKQIDGYRPLAGYFTSNGFNADEYDKVFSDADRIDCISDNTKALYDSCREALILIDANITNIASDAYYEIYNTNFEQLLASYQENYVVMNKNYYNKYMNLLDVNGKLISISGENPVVLVPEKYKTMKEVERFCQEQYNAMMNYDCFYKGKAETERGVIEVVYVQDGQITPLLNEYLLETGKEIKDSIIFVENGELAGTWYLSALSNGKLAVELEDRDKYEILLQEYGLDQLLSAGTMLTPISEEIRYYEFLVCQSVIFVMLFVVTLGMILFFSNYLEVMVNRKRYAVKYLMGFSAVKNMGIQLMNTLIILSLVIPFLIWKQNVITILVCTVLDIVFLTIMVNRFVFNHVSDVMKGE